MIENHFEDPREITCVTNGSPYRVHIFGSLRNVETASTFLRKPKICTRYGEPLVTQLRVAFPGTILILPLFVTVQLQGTTWWTRYHGMDEQDIGATDMKKDGKGVKGNEMIDDTNFEIGKSVLRLVNAQYHDNGDKMMMMMIR